MTGHGIKIRLQYFAIASKFNHAHATSYGITRFDSLLFGLYRITSSTSHFTGAHQTSFYSMDLIVDAYLLLIYFCFIMFSLRYDLRSLFEVVPTLRPVSVPHYPLSPCFYLPLSPITPLHNVFHHSQTLSSVSAVVFRLIC